MWQDLAALTRLGHEVHLIACDPDAAIEPGIAAMAASVTTIRAHRPRRPSLKWMIARAFNPETLLLRLPDIFGHRSEIKRALDKIRPDLVWAEEQLTAVFVPEGVPYVLGHVDFYFRLKRVRSTVRKLRRPNTMTQAALERFEYDLSRRARVTLVCSATDEALFKQRGIAAAYIPVVGPTLPPPDPKRFSAGRFFLFGKSNTAMRAALQHFRAEVWPALDTELRRDWHQVGDPPQKGANEPGWQWLTENFKVHGFVDDIAALFQYGDGCVMPYPFDASGHAKYSVSMGYGMVNIGFEPAFRSTPELEAGVNCLAPSSTAEMVDALRSFRLDAGLRRRLADASRATYEQCFSFEAQLPRFERLLAIAS